MKALFTAFLYWQIAQSQSLANEWAIVKRFWYNQNWETAANPTGNPNYELLGFALETTVFVKNDNNSIENYMVALVGAAGAVIGSGQLVTIPAGGDDTVILNRGRMDPLNSGKRLPCFRLL